MSAPTLGEPWRIMTPEEYADLRIIGPHLVEKNHDGAGGVAVWLTPFPSPPEHSDGGEGA